MREIPKKNYIILLLLVAAMVVVTFALKRGYENRNRKTSVLYHFLSEVTLNDLDTYLSETETAVIYIDDKYNLEDSKEQEKLKAKIIELNLNHNFVFLDSNNINADFIKSFRNKYHYNLTENYPTIIIMNSKRVINAYTELNVDSIDFEEIK